jgi:hypothetical protein
MRKSSAWTVSASRPCHASKPNCHRAPRPL